MEKTDNIALVAAIIAGYEDSEKADAVIIDEGGGGAGIWSYGINILRRSWTTVNFGSKSSTRGCLNKRAEMWNDMKEWLKLGSIPDIPIHKGLYKQLLGPELVPRVDGKIQLESTEDMKRRKLASPDLADALAITFALPIQGINRQLTQAQMMDTLGNNLLGSYESEIDDPFSGISTYI